VDFKEKG
jgi:hypothetical protein